MGKAGEDFRPLVWKNRNDFRLGANSGLVMLPFWVVTGFQTLGWVFIFFIPFGLTSWIAYVAGIGLGIASGLWTLRKYRVTVLERSEQGVVYSIRRRNAPVASAPTNVEADPAREPS